jgi:predicted O-linked N-acetylglucosamine transferase (SPINDLY family)
MRPEDYLQQGMAAHQAGRLEDAQRHYQGALLADPHNFPATRLLAALYIQRQQFAEAERLLQKAAAFNPRDASVQQNHAATLLALKRPSEAIAASDRSLLLQAGNIAALHIKANALMEMGRFADAVAVSGQALAADPNYVEGFALRGRALYQMQRHTEALASYDQLLARRPDHFDGHYFRAMALAALERQDDALAGFDQIIARYPNSAQVFYDRGNTLAALKRLDEARVSFEQAVTLSPDFPGAWSNLGTVLLMLARPQDAITAFDRALALAPEDMDAWKKRASGLATLHRHDEAIASYERAIALNPRDASTYVDMAYVLQQAGREAEALAAFDKARALNVDTPHLAGGRMMMKLVLCDWQNFDANCADLLARTDKGEAVGPPFTLLATPASAEQELKAAARYIRDHYPPVQPPLRAGARYRHDRIRIAYVSTDFRAHATAVLMMEPLEAHDHARFETVAISLGPNDQSPFRARLEGAFDRFIEARDLTDADIAARMADMEIDIAVDLNGHTGGARTGVFARRPAPLQVNYVGYPGTMGADYYDYLIADRVLVPVQDERFFSEKIAALPGSYQPNTRRMLSGNSTRASCGLPDRAFVFSAINNTFKITPAIFDVWMRLLRQVEGSVLWLQEPLSQARDNLRREAAARGVTPERLVFAPRLRIEEHLARNGLADLFLDTPDCNAHTTASDALWCGLPLVTCKGHTFAGRVAASLLSAIGMEELMANSVEDYEKLALGLASNPARLAEIRARLAKNRDDYGLFDASTYTRKLEAAFHTMWRRHQDGLPPESFTVSA